MTELIFEYDHLLIHSEYRTPEVHSHLASHLIISLEGSLKCDIQGVFSKNAGVCIASDVPHTVYAETGDLLLYLFDTTCILSDQMHEKYLHEESFCTLDTALVNELREIWKNNSADTADHKMLERCGLLQNRNSGKDERITAILDFLQNTETISDDMKKGYIYYRKYGNVTDAAMRAGFDSPSHFAATCKRMFGISFSEIMKS